MPFSLFSGVASGFGASVQGAPTRAVPHPERLHEKLASALIRECRTLSDGRAPNAMRVARWRPASPRMAGSSVADLLEDEIALIGDEPLQVASAVVGWDIPTIAEAVAPAVTVMAP